MDNELNDLRVIDLMIPGCNEWDVEAVTDLFCDRDAKEIISIPLPFNGIADRLVWQFSNDGLRDGVERVYIC